MEHRDAVPRDVGTDRIAARAIAVARLALLLGLAAGGSFAGPESGRVATFFVVVAIVVVPWAVFVLFLSEGTGERPSLLARTAWVGDLATILLLRVLVPDQQRTALLLSLAVVAISGYVVRSVPAWVVPTTAAALTLSGQLLVDSDNRVAADELVLYAGVLASVGLLMSRVGGQQRWAAARALQLEGRAGVILDSVTVAIVLTDAAGRARTLNPAARQLVGGGGVPGQHCSELLRLHDGERALSCAGSCALLGLRGVRDGVRLWRPRPDGTRQPVLATAAVVRGSVAGDEIVHTLRDITRLMEAEEAKTLFLATTSHELKTPLTVIKGFADSLLRSPDPDPELVRTALEAISRRSVDLAKIVDRLLMSSRIEAGQLSVPLELVDVGPLVAERVSAIQAATGRTVELSLAEGLPPASANADALVTVVEHLVDNALKYTPEERAVYVTTTARDDGRVVVSVRDEGVGMDAEQREHCFDKFWQAESGSARRYGGTGIGLYIVRSLVDACGADITVRSEVGQGSEFTLVLAPEQPAGVPAPRDADEPAAEPSMIREFMRQIGVPAVVDR